MEKNKYKDLVAKHTPKENRLYNGMLAFIIGGCMGVLGNFLLELISFYLEIPTKEAGTFMIIVLIFIGCLLTCFGFFDKWVNFAKAGLIVPITGFAHSMMSSGMEYKTEGPIFGIGSNIFKLSGSVILYGVVSAWFFGMIRYLIGGGS